MTDQFRSLQDSPVDLPPHRGRITLLASHHGISCARSSVIQRHTLENQQHLFIPLCLWVAECLSRGIIMLYMTYKYYSPLITMSNHKCTHDAVSVTNTTKGRRHPHHTVPIPVPSTDGARREESGKSKSDLRFIVFLTLSCIRLTEPDLGQTLG